MSERRVEKPPWIIRFEFELPAILGVAREGDNRPKGGGERLRYTWNVISYFVWCVNNDQEPIDPRVLTFIADFLKTTRADRLARETLYVDIFQAVDQALREGYRINPAAGRSASVLVADYFHCTPEKIINIYYRVKREAGGATVLHSFCRCVETDAPIPVETRRALAKELAAQGNTLLAPDGAGERLRAKLRLAGYGWWRRRGSRHHEIARAVELHRDGSKTTTYRTLAARYNLSEASVKKIHQRRK